MTFKVNAGPPVPVSRVTCTNNGVACPVQVPPLACHGCVRNDNALPIAAGNLSCRIFPRRPAANSPVNPNTPNPFITPTDPAAVECESQGACAAAGDGTKCLGDSCRCGCTANADCTVDPLRTKCLVTASYPTANFWPAANFPGHYRGKCVSCMKNTAGTTTNKSFLTQSTDCPNAPNRVCAWLESATTENVLKNRCAPCDSNFNQIVANVANVGPVPPDSNQRFDTEAETITLPNGLGAGIPLPLSNKTVPPNPNRTVNPYPIQIIKNIARNGCREVPANVTARNLFCVPKTPTDPADNECHQCINDATCAKNVFFRAAGKLKCDIAGGTYDCIVPPAN